MAGPPSRYVVAGNPVAHSQSPFIHAAFAAQTGEPIAYDRLLCPLDGFVDTVGIVTLQPLPPLSANAPTVPTKPSSGQSSRS